MRKRRRELMLSQADLARSAGIGELTVRSVERGERGSYRLSTLRGLTEALGWSRDSIQHVLDGGEPTVEEDEPEPPMNMESEIEALRAEVARLRAVVEQRFRSPSA